MLLHLPAHCAEELLSEADLRLANLSGANLIGANLSRATVTLEQLEQAANLTGTIMRDGTKHE